MMNLYPNERDTRSGMGSALACISSSTPTYSEGNCNFPEIFRQQIGRLDSGTRVFPGGAVAARNEITHEIVWGLSSESGND